MKFKLTLTALKNNQLLPFNYQYGISAWIYSLIAKADQEYAHFLHEKGYSIPGRSKSFKDFVFSDLQIPKMAKPKPGDQAILLQSPDVFLLVSFYIDQSAENFIVGLFENQALSLFNRDYRADFAVSKVESLPAQSLESENNGTKTVTLRTLSPVVLATKNEQGIDQYLAPDSDLFRKMLAINLADKYASLEGGLKMDPEVAERLIRYRLLPGQSVRSRLLTIKENKESQTRVRGYYNFSFELSAPTAILQVALGSGIGKYSSAAGCGFVDLEEGVK